MTFFTSSIMRLIASADGGIVLVGLPVVGLSILTKVTCAFQVESPSTMALPPRLILYIPTRGGYNGLILMNAVKENDAWTLTPAEAPPVNLTVYKPALPDYGVSLGKIVVRNCDGILLSKMVKQHVDIVVTDAVGQHIMVISMSQHTTVFGSHKLHKNFTCFIAAPPQQSVVPPAPAPSPKQKKEKEKKPQVGGLNPYVAKQLFDLATLRKEQCPIVAEEFILGNTAVMPCGHLFMQMAIEESFKKEPNKCPWCRQMGAPTYI